MSILSCMQILSSLAWLKCIKNTVILGWCWWFLTGVSEDWIIFAIKFYTMNQHCMSLLSCVAIFSSIVWLEGHQKYGHTWRRLMVPEWSWGWFGPPCCVGSSWDTLKKLSWKFHKYSTWFSWDIAVCKVDYISLNSTQNFLNRFWDPLQ